MNQDISDRTLEIFYTLIRGECLSNRKIADRYGVSARTVSRDISRIQNFFYEHRDIMNNAEIVYSHKDKAYILKSDEFLKNAELFALVKVILGARCFSKEDTMVKKYGEHFENREKLFDHAKHNGTNICMAIVLLALCCPFLYSIKEKYAICLFRLVTECEQKSKANWLWQQIR